MTMSYVISATKANRFFWLGRYEERVYLTMHLLRKVYDGMIDGKGLYDNLRKTFDYEGQYKTDREFILGMLYDEGNPSSVLSGLNRAMDNAMLLRENIRTETLSYLEMSIALVKRHKEKETLNITDLQPVTDWLLAFWGSAEQRIHDRRTMMIMKIGYCLEYVDMLIRFDYSYERIINGYEVLVKRLDTQRGFADDMIENQLNDLMAEETFNLGNEEYKHKLLKFINQLVRV